MNLDDLKDTRLDALGLDSGLIMAQLSVDELVLEALKNNEAMLVDSGAIAVDTGKFKGRSPKDRYIVADEVTENKVNWGEVNQKFSISGFDQLLKKMLHHLKGRKYYCKSGYACADPRYRLPIALIAENAYSCLFAHQLFLRYKNGEIPVSDLSGWTIICLPSFQADPKKDSTRQENFSILNFSRRMILIGGTGYTGEIKKGIFSVLNFLLPELHEVLPMHCSANVGKQGDTAIFFGLSGTGKTTLSADPQRQLIGDDEHGWTKDNIFNFEGGCYAKVVDLSPEREPQIYGAIRHGALLENVVTYPGTLTVDFSDTSKTENTRVAYPIEYIKTAKTPSIAGPPENIFFLTCDAYGVLPPISLLSEKQVMFYFLTGYTAKVAGTETGVTDPQVTFSSCFGKAFLPLHPVRYATMLLERLKDSGAKVWLVNTGWTGGGYGTGTRMKLAYTREMISMALSGELGKQKFSKSDFFGLQVPETCGAVPTTLLNPKDNWADKDLYDLKAAALESAMDRNFEQYKIYVGN